MKYYYGTVTTAVHSLPAGGSKGMQTADEHFNGGKGIGRFVGEEISWEGVRNSFIPVSGGETLVPRYSLIPPALPGKKNEESRDYDNFSD